MNLYLLFKSLHLIAVISWMAGLLYLPRIFVYHSEAQDQSQKNIFKIMERKLYNYIMTPAMLLSWLLGALTKLFFFAWRCVVSWWFRDDEKLLAGQQKIKFCQLPF